MRFQVQSQKLRQSARRRVVEEESILVQLRKTWAEQVLETSTPLGGQVPLHPNPPPSAYHHPHPDPLLFPTLVPSEHLLVS